MVENDLFHAPISLESGARILSFHVIDERGVVHATRADLLRRLARIDEAREAYSSALRFVQLEPERRFLQRQLDELGD